MQTKTKMAVFISKAYDEGMRDALAGRDYSNPYIPPQGSDETFDWQPDHEESYGLGYEAHYEDFDPSRADYHAVVDDMGRD